MLGEITWLANRGVDVFRMDAVPFMWKRLGHLRARTSRRRTPCCSCCMPSPGWPRRESSSRRRRSSRPTTSCPTSAATSGTGRSASWRTTTRSWCCCGAASRRATPGWRGTRCGRMRPIPPSTTWVTYVRGHDDIGWAVTDADAAAVGLDGHAHRRFLTDFYAGRFPGSFARGAPFQENEATGDARDLRLRRLPVRHRGRPSRPATTPRWRPGSAASSCCTRSPTPGAASRCSTWATSWRCATTAATCRPGPRPGQPVDAPPADGLGRGRRGARDPATLEERVLSRRPPARGGAPVAGRAARRGGARLLDAGDDAVLAWRRRSPRGGAFVGLANVASGPRASTPTP